MAPARRRNKSLDRKIMLLQDGASTELSEALGQLGHKVVRAASADEASRLLEDAIFIGTRFDALLADCHLNDSSALRVIRDFRNEFKTAPVVLMTHQDDIATAIWANTKGIPILEKPVGHPELIRWLSHVQSIPA